MTESVAGAVAEVDPTRNSVLAPMARESRQLDLDEPDAANEEHLNEIVVTSVRADAARR